MRLNDKNNICPCSVHKLFNVEEVPLPVEAVEDAEWRGREPPDCGPHVLDVPHGGPLPSLVIFRQQESLNQIRILIMLVLVTYNSFFSHLYFVIRFCE